MRPDIFISYAREDEAWVAPLAAALEASGRSVFWDRHVPAGRTWRSHIGAALEQARCVVVGWSEHAVASKFVLEEAGEGKERDILVPVLRTPVRPPFGFREIHAADLSGWSSGRLSPVFDRFLADLDAVLGAPAPRPSSDEVAPVKPVVREVGSADTAVSAGEPADRQVQPPPATGAPQNDPSPPPIWQPAKLGHLDDGGNSTGHAERRRIEVARGRALDRLGP
ncbi:MAG: toll/interleukin-1 receptor domain-containing protein [Geminicoccaceae bacterium]